MPQMKWIDENNEQKPLVLRVYDIAEGNVPMLEFNPLKRSDAPNWNPMPEEWHCYSKPLRVLFGDYRRLLKSYFALMFPTKDAFDGTPEPEFDELYYNWLSAEDWRRALAAIAGDLPKFPEKEREFYEAFLKWFDEALELSDIVICESNL